MEDLKSSVNQSTNQSINQSTKFRNNEGYASEPSGQTRKASQQSSYSPNLVNPTHWRTRFRMWSCSISVSYSFIWLLGPVPSWPPSSSSLSSFLPCTFASFCTVFSIFLFLRLLTSVMLVPLALQFSGQRIVLCLSLLMVSVPELLDTWKQTRFKTHWTSIGTNCRAGKFDV